MTESWHSVDTMPLHILTTEPIELAAGGGLGCPEGRAAEMQGEAP